MTHKHSIVTITYDAEYKLYSARCEDAPGMFVDSPSLEEAIEVVMDVLPEMIEDSSVPSIPLFMVDPNTFSHVH